MQRPQAGVEQPADLNPKLRELIARCLEKDPRNRWHDIADVRLDLQAVLGDPTGLRARAAPEVPHTRLRSSLVSVSAIVFGVVLGVIAWNARAPEPAPVVRFSYVLPAGQQFIANNTTSVVAVSPDGSSVAYSAGGVLYVKRADAFESTPIVGGNAATPFFSPDGQSIGYWSLGDLQLKRIPLTGGTPVVIAAAATRPRGTPSWGTDDTIVLGHPQGIMSVSATGGTAELLVPGAGLASPQILSDGRLVLFSEDSAAESRVVLQSLETGERTVLFPDRYVSPRLSADGNSLALQAISADGVSHVWVLDDLSGDTQIRQLTTEGNNIRPVWLDGRRLAFGSDRDGPMSIDVQAADGSGVAERLTTAEEGTEHRPESWSPSRRLLSFSVLGNAPAGLWVVSPEDETAPEPFYDVPDSVQRDSAFSPDGNWLA